MKDQKVVYINKELHSSMKALAAMNGLALSALIENVLTSYSTRLGIAKETTEKRSKQS